MELFQNGNSFQQNFDQMLCVLYTLGFLVLVLSWLLPKRKPKKLSRLEELNQSIAILNNIQKKGKL